MFGTGSEFGFRRHVSVLSGLVRSAAVPPLMVKALVRFGKPIIPITSPVAISSSITVNGHQPARSQILTGKNRLTDT